MATTTPINAATAAYGNASRLINQAARPSTDLTATAATGGNNFADLLAQNVQGVVDQGAYAGDDRGRVALVGEGAGDEVVEHIDDDEGLHGYLRYVDGRLNPDAVGRQIGLRRARWRVLQRRCSA